MIRVPNSEFFTKNVAVTHEYGRQGWIRKLLAGDQRNTYAHTLGCLAQSAETPMATISHVTVPSENLSV